MYHPSSTSFIGCLLNFAFNTNSLFLLIVIFMEPCHSISQRHSQPINLPVNYVLLKKNSLRFHCVTWSQPGNVHLVIFPPEFGISCPPISETCQLFPFSGLVLKLTSFARPILSSLLLFCHVVIWFDCYYLMLDLLLSSPSFLCIVLLGKNDFVCVNVCARHGALSLLLVSGVLRLI